VTEHRYVLRGDADIASAATLRTDLQFLVATTTAHLLIDCTHLSFIDSSGIAVLLEAHRDLEQQQRYMLIANVPRRLRRAFEVLGLTDLLRYDRAVSVSDA